MRGKNINRRQFLKKVSSAAVGATGFAYIIQGSALGKDGHVATSNRIVMGCIGMGGRGTRNMQGFIGTGQVQVVAVCDVDVGRLKRAQELLASLLRRCDSTASKYNNKDCATYRDYREMLARGIKQGVYDEKVVKEACRTNTIQAYKKFSPYIDSYRKKISPRLWVDLEHIATRWMQEDAASPHRRPIATIE